MKKGLLKLVILHFPPENYLIRLNIEIKVIFIKVLSYNRCKHFLYMKKIILFLFAVSFLFQSCFSYREIEKTDNLNQIGWNYKVKSEGKSFTGKLISQNDSIIKLNNGFNEKEFKISEIDKIERKKFSVLKTLGLAIGIPAVLVGVIIATYDVKVNAAPSSPN